MTIQDIINQLEELGAKLEAGRLGSEEVIEMADLSRDLYERLVVIRHKSYEDLIREERNAEVVEEPAAGPLDETLEPETPPVSSEKEVITEAISEKEPEPNSDRDVEVTGPVIPMGSAEISPNQISLIDSIEEIKRMEQSLNDKFQEKSEEKSLAQRLKQKPIEDLTSSIGINMKFRFITQLFNEDKAAFEVSVQKLNSFGSYIEADEYIQNTLSEQYGWNPKDPVVKELIDLAQRRYL
ncbi:MAG TPA: hypothetical protein VJ949_01940 [Cryomorphaceae bacterium]|nr:hypothetical protein [Cryomorphaceae bacterium]